MGAAASSPSTGSIARRPLPDVRRPGAHLHHVTSGISGCLQVVVARHDRRVVELQPALETGSSTTLRAVAEDTAATRRMRNSALAGPSAGLLFVCLSTRLTAAHAAERTPRLRRSRRPRACGPDRHGQTRALAGMLGRVRARPVRHHAAGAPVHLLSIRSMIWRHGGLPSPSYVGGYRPQFWHWAPRRLR